jgi:hypothetical protein
MDTVYLLWHSHPTGANENNDKLIGVYSSEDKAKSAQERLAKQPGFKDCVEGFEIAKRTLDKDSWTEGYFTE